MTKVQPANKSPPAAKHTVSKGAKITGSAQKVLNVVAALSKQKETSTVARDDIATVVAAQYQISGKSTVANAYTILKDANMIAMVPKAIEITDLGLKQADTSGLDIKVPKNTQVYRRSS